MKRSVAELAPRDDLVRLMPKTSIEFREDESGGGLGTLFGHFAVFNEWTEIDSWYEGKFLERIAPRAFRKTIKDNRDAIQVLFNHGFDPQIGDKPLGVPETLKEDDTGAFAETPLDDTSYNRDIAALLRSGALRGQSFRFKVTKDSWEEPEEGSAELPKRTIQELRLYEFGPVTFPAYQATTAGIRSRSDFDVWRRLDEPGRREFFDLVRKANGTPTLGAADPTLEPESLHSTSTSPAERRRRVLDLFGRLDKEDVA